MKKLFFIKLGSMLEEKEVIDFLHDRLDANIEQHESIYLGKYYKYSGIYADTLTVSKNKISDCDWLEENHKNYPIIISIGITNGRNADKYSKLKFIKAIFGDLKKTEVIHDSMVEEPN